MSYKAKEDRPVPTKTESTRKSKAWKKRKESWNKKLEVKTSVLKIIRQCLEE